MEVYLNSADFVKITEYAEAGLVTGITTNPSLMAASGTNPSELASFARGLSIPISIQAVTADSQSMEQFGRSIASISENVVVKLPATRDGFTTCRRLSLLGIRVNITLCYSVAQAVFAANVGAAYTSFFVSGLRLAGQNVAEHIMRTRRVYEQMEAPPRIIAAAIKTPEDLDVVLSSDADILTTGPDMIEALMKSEMTVEGLKNFMQAWHNRDPA